MLPRLSARLKSIYLRIGIAFAYLIINYSCGFYQSVYSQTEQTNVKKIAFGNEEHTTDQKMGVSVLLRLFISSNEVYNTAYAL